MLKTRRYDTTDDKNKFINGITGHLKKESSALWGALLGKLRE